MERKCVDLGLPRPMTFAYPAYGTSPEALWTLRERGYRFARVGDSRPYDSALDDPLLIPSFSTTGENENAALRVLAALRQAKDGKIVVLTIHGVPDTAHPHVTTSPQLFERYLQFLADEKFHVIAMRDLAKYASSAARVGPTATERYAPRMEKMEGADAWRSYFTKSDAWAAKQAAALADEVKVLGLKSAKRAPSSGNQTLTPELAEAVLSYQLPCGGWSKAVSYSEGPRTPGTQWTSGEDPWHYAATFDNRATTSELRFLSTIPSDAAKAAVLRGVDYVLDAQFPNGGWPQNYPLEGGYHDFITLNDGSMLHVLNFLEEVASGSIPYPHPERARAAIERGNGCLLRLQIRSTVWCAQSDPISLAPAHARLFEPASLSGGESVEVVRYLMNLSKTPERTKAIESALAWFASAKTFTDDDKQKWARFYDLKKQQPIFVGKSDGRTYETYEAMREKNPGGYDYLVSKPADLIGKWAMRWREGK